MDQHRDQDLRLFAECCSGRLRPRVGDGMPDFPRSIFDRKSPRAPGGAGGARRDGANPSILDRDQSTSWSTRRFCHLERFIARNPDPGPCPGRGGTRLDVSRHEPDLVSVRADWPPAWAPDERGTTDHSGLHGERGWQPRGYLALRHRERDASTTVHLVSDCRYLAVVLLLAVARCPPDGSRADRGDDDLRHRTGKKPRRLGGRVVTVSEADSPILDWR